MSTWTRFVACTGFVLIAWTAGASQTVLTKSSLTQSDLLRTTFNQGLDEKTIEAYKRLGGRYGGWLKGRNEVWDFQPLPAVAARGLPGFRFNGFPDKIKLPEVDIPFGLELPNARDAGLKNIAHLSNLVYLNLGSGVSDAGLEELAPLVGLEELILRRDLITDAGMKHLARLTNLTSLELFYSGVKGPGLKDLAPLNKLKSLSLLGSKVTDEGFKNLPPLKKLSYLNLAFTQVSDEGMKELARLPSLSHLDLSWTKITEKGLQNLAPLKKLRQLQINSVKVSEKAVRDLHQALPQCAIHGPR